MLAVSTHKVNGKTNGSPQGFASKSYKIRSLMCGWGLQLLVGNKAIFRTAKKLPAARNGGLRT